MAKKTGSTGNFPNGKLNSSDEGEMNIGIDFGEPTCWIGLAKNDVIYLSDPNKKNYISTFIRIQYQDQ